MASTNKMKKLKNAYLRKNNLKNKIHKGKRLLFFTASQRKDEQKLAYAEYLNKAIHEENENGTT